MMPAKKIISNSAINLLGQVIPFLTALLCIPMIIKGLGVDRFGVLNLIWLIVGYFSFLDLGLGRAITQIISSKANMWPKDEISHAVWSTIVFIVSLSMMVSAVLIYFSSEIAQHFLSIPTSLINETKISLILLALSIPMVVTSSVIRGILEGFHAFRILNLVRIPLGIFTYASPLIMVPFSPALEYSVMLILLSRIINVLVLFYISKNYLPLNKTFLTCIQFRHTAHLITQGGAITVSNIIGNLIVYLDKFIVGYLVSASAVAYYATTYEVVTKLWLIPVAITGVLFPLFSTLWVYDQEKSTKIFMTSIKVIATIIFPIAITLQCYSTEILTIWLGTEFAEQSYRIIELLTWGVFINCLAHIPFTYIQGSGQAYSIAKLHFIELLFYVPLVIFLTRHYGIEGTAIAWNIRSFFDLIALGWVFKSMHPQLDFGAKNLLIIILLSLILLFAPIFPMTLLQKTFLLSVMLPAIIYLCWFVFFDENERFVFIKAFYRNTHE